MMVTGSSRHVLVSPEPRSGHGLPSMKNMEKKV